MQLQISTDQVPDRHRFETWNDAISNAMAVSGQRPRNATGPFRARLASRSRGPMVNFVADADAHRVARQSSDIAHKRWDSFMIYREASVGSWFSHTGHEFTARLGDLAIFDADVPFETLPFDRFQLELWVVPKAVLTPHLPVLGRPLAMVLSGREGVDALAASYLASLTRNWDAIPETAMAPVVDTLSRLIGIACGVAAGAQPEAVRAGRLVEAKRHIEGHLTDPELSPASVAAALRMSIRALHLLFEPTGSSFSRYVQRRRLEECHAALLANPTRQVTDIAFAWGFNSLSGFYRAFHAAFGMTPGDARSVCHKKQYL